MKVKLEDETIGLPKTEEIVDGGQNINYFILAENAFVLKPCIYETRLKIVSY